jgi:hypothetical protein
MRACALSLSLVLSGCATGKDSFYQQWRDGDALDRTILAVGGVCMVGLLYLVYHESTKDGAGGSLGSSSEACLGECSPPTPAPVCYQDRDMTTGLPCR